MLDPVIFDIGALKITWFGLMLAMGFFSAYLTWVFAGRRVGHDSNFAADLLIWIMVSGILGARLGYILANLSYFLEHPVKIFMVNEGGLIFYGGLIGGILGMYIFARRKKMGFVALIDFVVTAVPVSHFFGRIGCFINGCCHGAPHDGLLSVQYPYMSQPWYRQVEQEVITRFTRMAHPVHPVQLYEGLFNLVLFVFLFRFYLKNRHQAGKTSGLYLMVYPVARICFEFLRGDERLMSGAFNLAQLLSIVLVATGAVLFIRASRKSEPESGI